MSPDERETRGIKAALIIEVVGRPPEHLIDTLKTIIKRIDEEKNVVVKSKKINEPKLMKDNKDFYTSFAEIEVEVEEILYLAVLMFKYMPAHVEVIEPELIALTNNGWNDIFNEITRRLHGYDEVAKILQFERGILEKRFREALGEEKFKEILEDRASVKKEKPKKKKKK
ncbi:MAG TPA: hypothetical protein ENG87_00220 [Candidatus Pacearchaeota archaeon]|nr:hypothetical protein BMS3Abin17_00685 [archaeon BMS3Abin17]HDK41774.1 hypothetical protein [Candidatus Pacearchaeota archaeon]HDZ61002.1 hypothetical protein [Candidatus Pacearchaeota archaeon]